MRYRSRRTSAPDAGFTLIEVVTVTGLLMVVFVSIMGVYQTMQRASVRQQSRSEAMDHLRIAMQRITKDVRQATDLRAWSGPDYIEIDTYIEGVEERVVYDATNGTQLFRRTADTDLLLLDNLSSTTIFAYTPDVFTVSVVTITLQVRPERFVGDDDFIDLTSEVRLRNT